MGELFVPAVNFGMLLGLLGYFVWPVFKKSVAVRRETIKGQFEQARIQKIEAEKKYREFESKLASFEAEAQRTLAAAVNEAEVLKNKIIKEAHQASAHANKDAQAALEASTAEMVAEIRNRAIAAAVQEAERAVRAGLSTEVQSKIIKEYVEKV